MVTEFSVFLVKQTHPMFCSFHLGFACFLICSIWPWLISLLNSFQPHEEDLSSNNGKDTCSLCCKEQRKTVFFLLMWGVTVEEQIRKQVVLVNVNTWQMLFLVLSRLLCFIIPEFLRFAGWTS